MRKILLPLALVAALATGTAAFAATNSATTGVIKAIDAGKAHTVTLGKTVYYFPAKFDLSKVKVGEKVTVTWTAKGKKDLATAIAAATA